MEVQRCWTVMNCGMQNNCPAYPDNGFACWNVEGTVCRGQRQGDYGQKIGQCRIHCAFYQGVMAGNIRIV
jgi:hypothetical protein